MNDQNLHEAPAVAWTNLFTKTGGKINVTVRAFSAQEALDELVQAVLYAKETYHFDVVPYSYASSAPPVDTLPETLKPVPVQTEKTENGTANTKTMEVDTIHKSLTENGKPYLKVKGAPFSKWGVKAWPEVVPNSIDFDALETGKEYEAPDGMRNAIIEMTEKGNPRKVIQFTA
jgi:hypothetical protein